MTTRYKQVVIEYKDEPGLEFLTTVAIGEWLGDEDDDEVFFYFSNREQFEQAKKRDNDLEFFIKRG